MIKTNNDKLKIKKLNKIHQYTSKCIISKNI